MLDRPSGTTRKEHIPSPNKSLESYKTSPSRPHSSGGLGLERSRAAFAAGRWACDCLWCNDGCTTSGCTADCAQGLTRWALLHPGHPVFTVRKRFDECHDPAKIQWYEGPAACERAISSDRQQQPVFRCAVCARSCISWTQHGPTTLTHKLALCGAHYGDLRQTGTKHTRTDRSEKGTPVNTRRHDDAALSDFQRRVSLSVWGASWSQASVCVLGTCVCIHTIIAPQCARRVRLVLLRRVPLC